MVSYPIRIRRDTYRGRDRRKQQKALDHNRKVAELEQKINEMLQAQTQPIKVYLWAEIARATGFSYDFVADVGYTIDGGSGGFTACAPGGITDLAAAINT
jgi:hypothetical protein